MVTPISASVLPSSVRQPLGKEEKKNTPSMKAENKNVDIEKDRNLEAAEYETRKAIFGSFEDAIKVFVEMLKHQDPMNPQDPGEMASKFAEFGQVIGLMDVKDAIKKSTEMEKNTQMLQAAAQIDKMAEFAGNRLYFSSEKSSEVSFNPPVESKYCTLLISTPDHKIVMSKTIEVKGGERNFFTWDGKDYHQNLCDKGTYLIKVTPLDENNKPFINPKTKQFQELDTYIKDKVSGGLRRNGTAMVMIGGEEGTPYSLENLLAIHSQQARPLRSSSAISTDHSSVDEELNSETSPPSSSAAEAASSSEASGRA